MCRLERADAADQNVLEVRRTVQQQVGAAALVCGLLVAFVAGSSRQVKPALQRVTPRCRLMDEIT